MSVRLHFGADQRELNISPQFTDDLPRNAVRLVPICLKKVPYSLEIRANGSGCDNHEGGDEKRVSEGNMVCTLLARSQGCSLICLCEAEARPLTCKATAWSILVRLQPGLYLRGYSLVYTCEAAALLPDPRPLNGVVLAYAYEVGIDCALLFHRCTILNPIDLLSDRSMGLLDRRRRYFSILTSLSVATSLIV